MAQRLSILNDPPKTLEGPQLLHGLIRWERHSDACAIDFTSHGKRGRYTYEETRSCVTSLVSRIRETLLNSGAQTGEIPRQHIVPVFLPQSPGLYISQIAILESGGAFCPINLDAPKERIKFVVGDISASVIVTTAEFKDFLFWENGPDIIVIDEFPSPTQNSAFQEGPLHDAQPQDLAYVMYTSGSSGTPKGVAVGHLAVTQSLLAHERHIPQFKRFLQFAAPSFDVSVFETFFPLTRGSTLVGCNRNQLLNDLSGIMNTLEVDAAELTPTVTSSLLQTRDNAPRLKLLLTIGEMLTKPIVEEFGGSETRESILYGMYGPTEAAIHCTIYPHMAASTKPGNIGIPLDTVSTFVAAAALNLEDAQKITTLPLGELGELVLGGPQLAQGYLNRKEQNKAAFVHHEGNFYYRTGDKARMLEDGTIEISGRISAGQVKLRGQRVELGEVENAVYKHAGVKTVVAALFGSALIVFALVKDSSVKSGSDVLNTCSKWLPEFMVPSEVVLLQNFPYLPSGKVDKRKLESEYQKQRDQEHNESSSSMTETERIVKETIEHLLGDFPNTRRLAAAGLDSLMAIRVSSKLRMIGFNVSTIAVLQADTLSTLAQLCEESMKDISKARKKYVLATMETPTVMNRSSEDIESVMPCTPLQSAMLSETAIEGKSYRNWVQLDLPGIDSAEQAISCFYSLAKMNSILRTGFMESGDSDGFIQIVWKTFPDCRIEQVTELSHNFDTEKDRSLLYPVRVQISKPKSGLKFLIHIHHALYDAWSLELLLDDFNSLLISKPATPRPPFAGLIEGYLNGTLLTDDWSSKDYWKDHLSHLDVRHMPKFHSPKNPSPGLSIARLQTSIVTSDIETASKRFSCSPQSLFQAAYSLILSSYLGSSDICFGTVFSGRTLPIPGIEDIAGPCLATLPIRVDVSTSNSLQNLVQQLNATNRKHLEHSTLPLRDIKSASGVHNRQQLFDTILIWQQTLHSYGHTRKHVLLVDTVDNLEFNLTLEIIPGLRNVELKANYQRSVFPGSQINSLLRQIEQLVGVIIGQGSTPLGEAFEHYSNDILSIENANPEISLRPGTLSSPVEKVAAEDPDRLAIEFARSIGLEKLDAHRVSYGDLNVHANQVGHYLLSAGVLPDDLICIFTEKSVDLYASILATAKIGAGYLPVTLDAPPERLQHILREAEVKFVVAQSSSRSLLEAIRDIKVFYLDEIDFTTSPHENISPRSSPDNISYCIFTSGSTGTPKGVLVTQGNLLSNLDALQELYPATKSSRLLQSCSQAFDVSVFEMFFTWRIGACLCSATKDVLFRDIENAIRVMNVTHLSLTPTVAALIDPKSVPKVQFLVTAGEAVTQKVFSAWADRGLYQGYGPSETTNICTVRPKVTQYDSINNIGSPFKNTSAFVLAPGPDFALVPRGGEGEFCFGGSQVFKGYIDKTQEEGKIIEHPTFGRLYRSGDFGRLMPDGSLAFTGRKDDQVKIRGQRVELGEINKVMLRSENVGDCITMVIDGSNDNLQRLVCFWTSRAESSTSLEFLHPDSAIISKLFKTIESTLPSYMVPSALIPISHIPSTTQGKIDKRLLIKRYRTLNVNYLGSTSLAKRSSLSRSWTDLELKIAQAVALVTKLPLDEIGPDSSFFGLGIDSISAIHLSRTLREMTEREVKISDILKNPSVVRLAERISSQSRNIEKPFKTPDQDFDFGFDKSFIESTIEAFQQAGKKVERILPCTPLQEAMLSAAESSSKNLYNYEVTLNITSNVDRLKTCWREMVRRHEVLRTCFVSTEIPRYAYAQVILEDHDLVFGDASQKPEGQGGFEPPYIISLLQVKDSTKMLISMHHALYDGVALTVLYEEVEKLYQDEALPAAISFAPFLRHIASIDLAIADKFWLTHLKNFTPNKVNHVNNQPAQTGKPSSRIQRTTSKSPLCWIETSTKKYSTSLLAVCHSAWSSVLSSHLLETDICFGNVVSGRTVPVEGIERLVAPCFNTIPCRMQNINNLIYLEAFRKFQVLNADSLPYQLSPLRRIQANCSKDGMNLFDTLFILQQETRVLNSEIWRLEEDIGSMDFPIVVEVVPRSVDDTLEITLHSHTSVISEEDAFELLKTFEDRIQTALENPRRQLLSAAFKEKIAAKMDGEEKMKSEAANTSYSSKAMSPEETKLRDVISIFTDVQVEKISSEVSIFRLGLDSISTVQVATRLRKQGHHILAGDILENPTIAQLSAYLAQQSTRIKEAATVYDLVSFDEKYRDSICASNKIPIAHVDAVRPCTAVQKGMVAQSLHSAGLEYVNSMWLELRPDIEVDKFKAAWKDVCAGHEMLRTGFAESEDPTYPFVMVTYAKEYFSLPWFQSGEEDSIKRLSSRDLLRRPWNLSLLREDSKTVVRFTAHHALYDAQSIQMILLDIAKAYASQAFDSRTSINSLLGAILYDSETDLEAKQNFWEKNENKIIVNRFPDLTPLRVSETTTVVRDIYSQTSTSQLEKSCRKNRVTMQAAAQATWARLLSIYIGETSTTFGMTLSGRSIHDEADRISFPSIVTLPVRCNVVGTNAELLSRTMSSNALLHKYQFTPLTSIQKWAGHPEGKIFDTLFAYQKPPDTADDIDEPWKLLKEEASVDYAVSLEVQPTISGQLVLRLSFRLDLIPVEHAELLLRQYDALLWDTLTYPENPCDLSPNVGDGLLSITPAKENSLPDSVTLLHEYVERGARDWPDKIALEFATHLGPENFESKTWTYDQLDKEGNRIAQLLLQQNVVPGQIVAICFDKCAEASFAIIGILKAGCAYVALDPSAPADRLKFIVQDSGAVLVVTAGKPGYNIAGAIEKKIINLDSFNILSNCSALSPTLSRKISSEDTSYCLYTSGTTGTPKGCLLSHSNAVQAMLSFQRLFAPHWTPSSKWLQFASFHFDVSVLEQFWSWSVGICVASAPRDLIFEDIPNAINMLGVTHIDLTPSLARLLHPDDVPGLCKGVFITGGEQLKQEILDVWGEYACIYNGYGPTEATIGVTMYPRVPTNGKPSNIGPQFDNVGSFVLKPGTALPILRGGIGELCVSGKLVGKGYLNRPDLTSERFPTLEGFNERVYRTGDLVRILYDGSFIFLGRADDQVKLRGQRLELSEINEVIKKSISDLQDVVTLVLKHITQQKEQLVTFFVARPSKIETDGQLISSMRAACKSRLPGYMVPTHFIPIEALPLNSNNKADSKQLAVRYNKLTAEDLQKLSHSNEQTKEWSEKEKNIVGIIAKTLQVDEVAVSRGSNIFELGLDSISVIGFSRALQNGGLANAKLSIVKSNPSIDTLINALLDGKFPDGGGENAYFAASQNIVAFSQKHMFGICMDLRVQSSEVEAIAPCTPVQEGMIYRFLESDVPLYFHRFEFDLDHGVHTEKLLNAWKRVMDRLQILRTKFVETNDGYAQVVMKTNDDCWRSQEVKYETVSKSLALRMPCKFYTKSISSGNVMVVRIFHGLYDGNSFKMLFRRVVDEYRDLEEIDYGPSFQSSLPYGPLVQAPGAQEFWTDHLNDWSPQTLPTASNLTKPIIATTTISNLTDFESLRKSLSVTHQAILQAAWVSILQTLLSPNLTIGLVTSGRAIDFLDADKIIGPLFNTIPFHINIENGMTAAELAMRCHEFNLGMQGFQHTPLKDVQKWSKAKAGQALFESLFVFQRPEVEDEGYANGIWTEKGDGEMVADYPLAFEANLSPDSNTLALTIVAQGTVITQAQADDLLEQERRLLLEILAKDGKNIISTVTKTRIEDTQSKVTTLPEPTSPGSSSKLFTWTKQAQQIRAEISLLANVTENSIHSTSSIFELGLDSIDVIKLSSRLKRQSIEIAVSVIIKCQTISKMVLCISRNSKNGRKVPGRKSIQEMSDELRKYLESTVGLTSDVEAVWPATPLQQSMVKEMVRSRYKRYFNVEVFKLHKGVNLGMLAEAIKMVIDSSPILRTSFVEIEDPRSPVSYAQIIHSPNSEHVVSSFSTDTLLDGDSVEKFMDNFKSASVNLALENQALLHLRFALAGNTQYLAMAISHALYDGSSLRALHDDISKAYHGSFSPRPDSLFFLEEIFQSTTDDAKSFWKTTLSNLPSALLPLKEASQIPNPSIVHHVQRKSRIPLKAIETFCKSSRITLQTLGQTCWALVLSNLMGQLDVVFGSVLSCRDSEEANQVMFPLMNTVAVRSVIHGSLDDMLKYMQDMSDMTREYQHFPLGTAQAYALASRNGEIRDTTLFDTLFIYQGRRALVDGQQLYESVYGVSDVEFPVCVEMEIVDDHLTWTTACKLIVRSAEETGHIIDGLEKVLERLVSVPQAQAFEKDAEGISVCGLPKFENLDPEPKTLQAPISKSNENESEWSITELNIRKALQEISNAPENTIHKDSTIFHLGLDSILILKLPALLKTYKIKLRVSDILKEQTISAMAKAANRFELETPTPLDIDGILKQATSAIDLSSELRTLEEKAGEIQEIIPVTAGQLFMIRQWQVSQGILFYPTLTYSLPGRVNKSRLDQAWRQLLQRHDVLRTGFIKTGLELVQVVFRSPHNDVIYRTQNSVPMRRHDLEFPPINLILEEAKSGDAQLKLVIHHALYDGISLPMIMEELQALYLGQVLEKPKLNFRAFVAQSIASNSMRRSAQDKWTSYLKMESPSRLNNSVNNNKRSYAFHPSIQITDIKQQAQKAGVTVDALLLAAAAKLRARTLSAQSSTSQVILGIYLANRAPFGEDLSHLAGPTLNLLPLQVQRVLERSITELAKSIQQDLQNIFSAEMSSASLKDIYEWTGVQVNCFVNILKDTTTPISKPSKKMVGTEVLKEDSFQLISDFSRRAEVIHESPNVKISARDDGRCDAYLPSIDLEIRYHGDRIDVGVFAPTDILSVVEAEGMIDDFVGFLD